MRCDSSRRPASLAKRVPPRGILDAADNCSPLPDGRADGAIVLTSPTAQKQKTWRSEALGEHTGRYSEGFGQSRQRSSYAWFTQTDVAILSASGPDRNARLKRLAQRAPTIDIFGSGYVLRDDEGWEITAAGRDFLRALEAVRPYPSRFH